MGKLQRYRFEQAVQDVSENSKEYLTNEYKAILESNKPYQSKCDYIAYSLTSIDTKINLLDEEIKQLQEYKNKLKSAKIIASEIGASVFKDYGITKIEGAGVSSITLSNETTSSKLEVVSIHNEDELINQGYYKKVIDKQKILKAYQDGTYQKFIEANASVIQVNKTTPARLRVNKRRAINNTNITIQEVA